MVKGRAGGAGIGMWNGRHLKVFVWTRAGRSILWSWVGLHCLGSTELCTIPAMVSGSPHRWWWNVCWNDVEVVARPAMLSTSHSGARTYAMHHFRGSPLKNVDPPPPLKMLHWMQ